MNDQIILTKEEAIVLLKAFSNIEGFLLSVKANECIYETIENAINLLTERLTK